MSFCLSVALFFFIAPLKMAVCVLQQPAVYIIVDDVKCMCMCM